MRTVVVLLMLMAPLAFAQRSGPKAPGAANAAVGASADDALTCEQIQAEMTSAMGNQGTQNMLAQQQAVAAGASSQVASHSDIPPDARSTMLAQLGAANAGAANASALPPGAAPAPDQSQAADSSRSEQADEPTKKRGGVFKGIGKALGGGAIGAFGGNRAAAA